MYLGKPIKINAIDYIEVFPAGNWEDITFLAKIPQEHKRISEDFRGKGQTPMLVNRDYLPALRTRSGNNSTEAMAIKI